MEEVSTIGLDLAKNVFQAHGASASGAVLFRKKLRREQVLTFFAGQPRCLVATRTMPLMPRRSARPPSARPCALSP